MEFILLGVGIFMMVCGFAFITKLDRIYKSDWELGHRDEEPYMNRNNGWYVLAGVVGIFGFVAAVVGFAQWAHWF